MSELDYAEDDYDWWPEDDEDDEETGCEDSTDHLHCECWYEGDFCCYCGD